jgi:hypothetical protein
MLDDYGTVGQAAQQVPAPGTPLRAAQPSAEDLMRHTEPQSMSAVQTTDGASVQVPVVRSQVLVGI